MRYMDNKEPKKKFLHAELKKPHYYGVKDGIHLFHGSHEDHKQHIGKHLENPSDEDLAQGLKEAKEKGLHTLYIHGAPPHSLRSQIHPELGAHVPGSLGKSEDLAKMAAKAKKILDENSTTEEEKSTQYWWKLNHQPSQNHSSFIKYDVHASDLKHIAKNYDTQGHHIHSHTDTKTVTKPHGTHTTALCRINMPNFKAQVKADPSFADKPKKVQDSEINRLKDKWRNRPDIKGKEPHKVSVPIAEHIAKNGTGEGKNILYYGCGRDYGGALALAGEGASLKKDPLMDKDGNQLKDNEGNYLYHNQKVVGGKNNVTLYDPYHYDESLKSLPTDAKFDEVHSHYVFNVIDHANGKNAINNISNVLKPDGKAIISARRDDGMKNNSDWEKLNSATQEVKARKSPTPKVGMKTKLNKGEPKKYPAKKKSKQPPQAETHFLLSDLHNTAREHCKDFGHSAPSDDAFAPKSIPRLEPVPIKKSELLSWAKETLTKIQDEVITITTRELTKGLSFPESKCDACGCKVEGCLCFEGFSEPEFTFDGKKLSILFKSDWDEASKESYVDDFKRRAGRLIKK